MSKKLVSLQAFLSDDLEITTILQLCGMQETKTWRQWISPFGTSLEALPSKKIRIGQTQSETIELFQNRSIVDTAQISKLIVSFQSYLGFWGDDDLLRVFQEEEGRWLRVCPLRLGLPLLRKIVHFDRNDLTYQEIDEGFISVLPLEKESWKPNLAFLMPAI